MAEKKSNRCICVAIVGLILVTIGLLADVIGLGKDPGFGPQQTSVLILGIIVLFAGLKFGSKFCVCKKRKQPQGAAEPE